MVAWLSPFENYQDEGFQIVQGLFALGTGSLSGAGPGLGRPDLIPNASTDFIFAALGEELGFAGTVASLSVTVPKSVWLLSAGVVDPHATILPFPVTSISGPLPVPRMAKV